MAVSPPNLHTVVTRLARIQGFLKVKVKFKGHVIRALFCILVISYSVIDGLVCQRNYSWTVREVITKFSEHYPMAEKVGKFESGDLT